MRYNIPLLNVFFGQQKKEKNCCSKVIKNKQEYGENGMKTSMKKFLSVIALSTSLVMLASCAKEEDPTLPNTPISSAVQSEPEPEPLKQAYLTGEEKTDDYPEGKRIAAVMVGNTPTARPAYGIGDAQILIEIEANAGITRFLAMYQDYETMPRVGSVRSARDPFVQLLIPTYGFFVHEGPSENQPARIMLQQYDYYGNYDLDNVRYAQSDRNSSIYNWYNTNGETIVKAIEKKGYDTERTYNSPFFSFVPYNEEKRTMADGEATDIAITLTDSFRTSFSYSTETGKYAMSQYNYSTHTVQPTVDGNNSEQLEFENVLVVFAPFSIYPGTEGEGGLTKVDFTQGGGAFLISNGTYERVIWRKGAPDQPLRLEKVDGSEETVELNPGKTYIAVVDDTRADAFGEAMAAGNSADQAVGEANDSLVDAA